MQFGGSPLHGGVEMVNPTGLGMDNGEGPATSQQREEVESIDNCVSHGVEQQEMTPEVDALKEEEGQLHSKSEMRSSSNLVKRMKIRPWTRRPAVVHRFPYRHFYWRRFRNSQLHSYKRKA